MRSGTQVRATASRAWKTHNCAFVFCLAISAMVVGAAAGISPVIGTAVAIGLIVLGIAATRPYQIVLFLVILMPFESLVLRYLPVSDRVGFALQFVTEFVVYLALLLLVLRKALNGQHFWRSPIDKPLLAFTGIAVLSTVVNRAPLFGSVVSLRSLLRYTALFYLVLNIDITHMRATWLLRAVLAVGFVQLFLAGLQTRNGDALNEFLLPRQIDAEIAGHSRQFILLTRGREIGSVFGTLGDTLFFALFMLVVFAVYLGKLRSLSIKSLCVLGIVMVAIGYAYARAAVFGTLLMLWVFLRLRYGSRGTIVALIVVSLVTAAGGMYLTINPLDGFTSPLRTEQSILENITGVFSRRYVEIAQKQRLGALLRTTPTVLVNRPLLGYGPDQDTTVARLNDSERTFLVRPLTTAGFEDVYWVAGLAYYGVVGVLSLALILHRLHSSAYEVYKKAKCRLTREIASTVLLLTALTPFLLLFYRVLQFRVYSFYFWLIPALMFRLHLSDNNCRSGELNRACVCHPHSTKWAEIVN